MPFSAATHRHAFPIRRLLLRACLVLVAAPVLFGSPARAATDVHEYTVYVDPALERLTVHARFASSVRSIAARSRDASRYLVDFRNCDRDPRIRVRNHRLIVPAAGIRCMAYTVDLRAAAAAQRHNRALADGNFVVSSSAWLWRPELNESTRLLVDFELPSGINVSVPWQPVDDSRERFTVGQSPESAHAPVAFGGFEYREVDVAGARLRIGLMRGKQAMDSAEILRWIEAAATDVSLAYGRFPNPHPQVLVIPVTSDDASDADAVPFGRVIRDGGETIELYVNQYRPLSAFLDDWTATHEFSHLMLPYVTRQNRWISEGFAQYYQNILLARSGTYDDLRAWQKLHEGFERGRRSRPELSPNDAAAGGTRAGRMKVYWSGAVLALMADVELRKQSGGEQSLDDVLRELQACCLPSARVWTGPELFAKLDELAGQEVFGPLYKRYANTIGFPDPRPVFDHLGIAVDDGKVRIRRNARLDHIRFAITAVDTEAAAWREQLALGD